MMIKIKEPYKTAVILGVTISVFVGVAYLVMPTDARMKLNNFFINKFKSKKDEREVAKTPNVG